MTVPAGSGKPEVLLASDLTKGEFGVVLPRWLPGGQALLFSIQVAPDRWNNPRVELLDLRSHQQRILLEEGAHARYSESGNLFFARQGTLCAVPFDLSRPAVTGAPVPLIPDLSQSINRTGSESNIYAAQFACYFTGTLAYVRGGTYPDPGKWILWMDRASGKGCLRTRPSVQRDQGRGSHPEGFRPHPMQP